MELETVNPYQAPAAYVADAPADVAAATVRLYAPAAWKFLLLSGCTLGLYLLVWFYRNWVAVRRARQVKLSPVARAIFSGITAYFCFEQMEDILAKRLGRRAPELHGGIAALLYFLLSATGRMPHPFWMISLLAPLPVLWVNQRVRAAGLADRGLVAGEPLSWGAWLLVAVGGCCFLLVLIGSFALGVE